MIGTLLVAEPVVPDFGAADPCVTANGAFCFGWFRDNWSGVFGPALVQHIQITVIAVGIGTVIAFALAFLCLRFGWLETPFTGIAGIFYTIPSLALFQLLVPITGLTLLTVEIAMISYTILMIFRNILIGIREVPAEVVDSATGLGYTPAGVFFKIKLRLAMPVIIAGIRVATVTVVSLATVAAFVVNMGLGAVIFDALQSPFNTQFIAAGVLAIAVALSADALLVGLQRLVAPWARRVGVGRP